MRDDDLSIPVLADVLEPGDPAKADPAIPRRPVEHAWTDALVLDTHEHPLGAVPTLGDVLVEGDPSRLHAAPQAADAALTIPLLTDVVSYHDAVGELSHHEESSGSPIPLLTDVVAESHEIPELTDVVAESHEIPELTDVVAESHEIPELTDVVAESHEIPELTDVVAEAHEIPELTDVVAESHEIPELTDAVAESHEIPELTDVVAESHEIPALTDIAAEAPDLSEPARFAADHLDLPAFEHFEMPEAPANDEALASSSHMPPDLQALASSIDAHLFDSELPFRAYCSFPGEKAVEPLVTNGSDVPTPYPMASVPQPFGSATEGDEHTAPIEAHAEPFEAPAEEEPHVAAAADPFRSVIAPEAFDSPAVEVHPVPFEPISAEALPEVESQAEPESPEAAAVEPFIGEIHSEVIDSEGIYQEGAEAAVQAPDALDTRDFGDHLPHPRVDASDHRFDHESQMPELMDFGHEEPSFAEPASVEPVGAEATAAEAAVEPAITEAAVEPAITEAAAEAASVAEPAAAVEPAVAEPAHAESIPAEPIVAESMAAEAELAESSLLESSFDAPSFDTASFPDSDTAVHAEAPHDGARDLHDAGRPVEPAFAELELVDNEPAANEPELGEAEQFTAEHVEAEHIAAEHVEPEPVSEPVAAHHAAVMSEDEADHVASILSRQEPVAAELTEPEPEMPVAAAAPTQAELDTVAADVGARALRYLSGEGHSMIESRCQEQAVWLAHRITREIATSLEREIGQWVQQALKEALERREEPK